MLIVGLTGNYGMGKSTVLDMFRELGAITVKTDSIVHMLLDDRGILEKIRKAFGAGVFRGEGALDRAALAAVVFRDSVKRETLEGILHPLVFQEIGYMIERLEKEASDKKVLIVEIPLLFEKNYGVRFHKTVTVYTDEETALDRLERAGVSRESALARLRSQMPIDEKRRRADFAVDNSGSAVETRGQVKEIYERLLSDVIR